MNAYKHCIHSHSGLSRSWLHRITYVCTSKSKWRLGRLITYCHWLSLNCMLAHHPPAPTAQVYRARDPKKKARGRTIQRALLSTSAPCVGSATGASVRVERTRRTRWRSALREKGALALSVYSRTVSREVSGDGEGGLLPRRLNGAYPA